MFFWARLTGEIDATRLLPYAIEHEVVYVPGKAFYADAARADLHAMRMSFATMNEAQIAEGMVRLTARWMPAGQRAGVDFAGGLILRKRARRGGSSPRFTLFPPVTLPAWQAYLKAAVICCGRLMSISFAAWRVSAPRINRTGIQVMNIAKGLIGAALLAAAARARKRPRWTWCASAAP